MSNDDEIAALRKEVAALKAKVDPPKSDFVPMTVEQHRDWVHQMNERRMNHASNFHPDDLRAMEAACPTSAVKDIVAHGHVPGPSGMAGASGQVTRVSSNPGIAGSNTTPLGPPPGINHVDRLMDEQDRRDRAELARKLGRGR
jgi:hypothetical protein